MANYDLTYEGSRVQGILDTGNSLKDAGYIFRGEATPSTVPGTPAERVAYIGGPGTYTNFGSSITVGAGCICVFKYTGSAWSNQVINTGLSDAISSEASARQLGDSTLQGGINTVSAAITAINNAIGNGCVYAGIATPSSTPASGKVFYFAFTAGTYTNFNSLEVPQGINILKNNGSTWLLDSFLGIDDAPIQGSDNLVKSGGVLNSIIQNGPAFDLSAYNAQGGTLATYADLSAALTALNALPADFKKGGMSMKYVQTSDNKYVQYRLMLSTFTAAQFTNTSNWQGVDEVPTAGSHNLVESGGVQTAIVSVDTKIANVDTKTDFTRRLVFTEGYAHIHPVSTDEEGKYIFDGNWTVEVKHQLVAEGFIKTLGEYNSVKYDRITIPNGNYNFTFLSEPGQAFKFYMFWYNIKTKTFYYGRRPANDDPNWFEAFEDISHPYYYWLPAPEGLISLLVTRKASASDTSNNEYAVIKKKEYIGDSVCMDNILPDDISDYPVHLPSITGTVLKNKNVDTTLVFSERLYRISEFPMENVNIVGAGIDKTIFSLYNATTNEETSKYRGNTFHTIHIKDCTIKNRGFVQNGTTLAVNKSATFENVKFWVTLGGSSSYLIFTSSKGFKLHVKNCILLNDSEGSRMYAGIWTDSAEYVEVINTRIGDYFTRPCANYYAHQAFIDNVDVTNGKNGIFFAANRENPLENTIVQNCTVRFVNEECISFDALGNNVAGNPMVCELSITDGEIIQDAIGSSYINKRLKLYCNARYLVGTHPNEHYEAYSIVEHADLIKKMYVAFDEPAGNVFAGTVVKVLDCGKETDGEEREWILIDTQLPFEDLNLLENTDITVVNNNYKVAMVTSGFFNVRVTHNKCYGGKNRGIALYNAIYHCTIDNNHVSNCINGSYLYGAKFLATAVYNGACGNIITNNVFEGGEEYGFDFVKFDKVFGYHNIFANNLILNNKGVRITYEKGLTYEGNSIIGPNAILDLSSGARWGTNVIETNKFGTVFPTAPTPGHRFFKTDENKEYMWNGTEWVE